MLLAKKVGVSKQYAELLYIFFKKSTVKLSNHLYINKHAIDLDVGKEPPYRPIYNLTIMKLKTFKTYIQTNLANVFIQPSKFLLGVPIFFVWKFDKSFYLFIDYQDLNNLIIKTRYLLRVILELVNWLEKAKRFT